MFLAAQIIQDLQGLVGYGYLGIILYMILTGLGLPMPEEFAIIAAGALSATGKMDWRLALGSLLIGAIVGDIVMYGMGYYFGRRLLNKSRYWQRIITPEREKKVEALLAKHGVKVLLGARFLVGLRGPMYITAGILKVPFRRFVVADMFCAVLVVTLFFALSYFFGAQLVHAIHEGEGWLTIAVIAGGIIAGGIGLWFYLRRKKAQAVAAPANADRITDTSQITGFLSNATAVESNGQPTPETPAAKPPDKAAI
jgi:membrane protein DedA with SNARE-associated domain